MKKFSIQSNTIIVNKEKKQITSFDDKGIKHILYSKINTLASDNDLFQIMEFSEKLNITPKKKFSDMHFDIKINNDKKLNTLYHGENIVYFLKNNKNIIINNEDYKLILFDGKVFGQDIKDTLKETDKNILVNNTEIQKINVVKSEEKKLDLIDSILNKSDKEKELQQKKLLEEQEREKKLLEEKKKKDEELELEKKQKEELEQKKKEELEKKQKNELEKKQKNELEKKQKEELEQKKKDELEQKKKEELEQKKKEELEKKQKEELKKKQKEELEKKQKDELEQKQKEELEQKKKEELEKKQKEELEKKQKEELEQKNKDELEKKQKEDLEQEKKKKILEEHEKQQNINETKKDTNNSEKINLEKIVNDFNSLFNEKENKDTSLKNIESKEAKVIVQTILPPYGQPLKQTFIEINNSSPPTHPIPSEIIKSEVIPEKSKIIEKINNNDSISIKNNNLEINNPNLLNSNDNNIIGNYRILSINYQNITYNLNTINLESTPNLNFSNLYTTEISKNNIINNHLLTFNLETKNNSYLVNLLNQKYLINKINNSIVLTNLVSKNSQIIKNNDVFKIGNNDFLLYANSTLIIPVINKKIFDNRYGTSYNAFIPRVKN
jgi:hypothetical protein